MKSSSLFRNTWLNLLGQGLPLALAFFVLPILIRWIGPERMGVLTTLWVVIGYFQLLDLGLGRAIIHLIADCSARGRRDEVSMYLWPALILIGSVSLLGGLAIGAFSGPIMGLLVKIPPQLVDETRWAFFAVCLSLPFVSLTSCLRGAIEARQKFMGANVLQGLSTGANVLVPLLTALFTPSLLTMAWALLAARALLLVGHFLIVVREFPELVQKPNMQRGALSRLFRFGTWSTVSNVVGPILVYLDRLVVSSRVPAAHVPNYAIPHEAVMRLLILPGALARALFPRFSSIDHRERAGLSKRVLGLATSGIFPVALVLCYFADELMRLWLGQTLGANAAPVLKILAIGYFLNAASHVPYIQIQSMERPDLSARIHLTELPIYLGVVYLLTTHFGVIGAAWAWLIRVAVDSVLMFWFAQRLHQGGRMLSDDWGVWLGALLLLPGVFLTTPLERAAGASIACAVFAAAVWCYWFDEGTHIWIRTLLRRPAR